MSKFDSRHVLPMVRDMFWLLFAALRDERPREGLIDVGRAIRHGAFEARDVFPCLSFSDVVRALGGDPGSPILLPEPAVLADSMIGGVAPYYYMGGLVMARKPKTLFEIGTFLGASALTMALNSSDDAVIHTVDLPEETAGHEMPTLVRGDRNLVRLARKAGVGAAFKNHPLRRKIVQVFADSRTINVGEIAGAIDFAVIDGGHSYELIKNDTEKCLSAASNDCVVVWDDYRWNLPGVHQYIHEIARELPVWRIASTQYIIHSPRLPLR